MAARQIPLAPERGTSDSCNFVLAGREFRTTKEKATKKLAGVRPEPTRMHVVTVDGKNYPVKQALSIISGLPKADFNSHQARHILKRLGFIVSTLTVGA
jgi:hypothetical protein